MSRGPAGVVRRTLGTTPRAGGLLAVVAFLAALLVTMTPRVLDQVGDDVLGHRFSAVSATSSALRAQVPSGLAPSGSAEEALATLHADLTALGDGLAEPLRSVVGAPLFRVTSQEIGLDQVPGHDVRFPTIVLAASVGLDERVRLTDGRWPVSPAGDGTGSVVEVVLAEASAERLAWPVGADRAAPVLEQAGLGPSVRLVGTYVANDPDDDYWAHALAQAGPQVVEDLNAGTTVLAVASTTPSVAVALGVQTQVWFPLEGADDLRFSDAERAASQLRGLTAVAHPAGGLSVRLATGALEPIESAVADVATLRTVSGFVLAAPLAALGLALVVAARLVVLRRADVLDVARARGASGAQLRTLMALQGLLLAVPGGLLGVVVALALTPGAGAVQLLAPVATTLAVPLVLAGSIGAGPARRVRSVLALALVAVAILATVLVLRRGLSDDPLLLATPALLALAVGLVVARVAPVPLRGLVMIARRRPDAAGVLGATAAVRDRRDAPLLGMVVGVGVAVLAVSLLGSVRAGIEEQTWQGIGADLRTSGPVFDPEAVAAVRAVPGVEAVATVTEVNPARVASARDQVQARAVLVDPDDLAAVQAGSEAWDVPELGRSEGPLVAVLAQGLARTTGSEGLQLSVAGGTVDLEVVDVVDAVPGATRTSNFVLVDRARVVAATGTADTPRVLLVDLDDDLSPGDHQAAAAAVLEATGSIAYELRSDALELRLADPTVSGLRALLMISLATGALGAVITVTAAQAASAPRTARTLTVLAVLGGRRGDAWRVAAWEIGGWAVLGLAGGLGLGLGLSLLAGRAADLGAFVGGSGTVGLAVDGLWVVAGVFVLAVLASVVLSGVRGRRLDVTAMLREAE